MLKKTNERAQEEEQKEEVKGEETKAPAKKKRTTGAELRLRRELADIDLPDHATLEQTDDPMKMKITIDLSKEDQSMWFGGVYNFDVDIPKTYPI